MFPILYLGSLLQDFPLICNLSLTYTTFYLGKISTSVEDFTTFLSKRDEHLRNELNGSCL